MSNLPVPCARRKPGRGDSPRNFSPYPSPPDGLKPKGNPGDIEMVDALLDEGATKAELKVFRHLCRACRRYTRPGNWEGADAIGEATGLGRRTVQKALDWLESLGYIARSWEVIYGRRFRVTWCLWLLPSGSLDREPVDMGFGVWSGPRPDRAEKCPDGAEMGIEPGAQGAAPEDSKVSKEVRRKTTDRANAGPVSSSSDRPAGEAEGQSPPAPPDIDPRIAELVGQLPDEATRSEVAARVPSLQSRFKVEWIVKALVVLLDQSRRRTIHDFGAFMEGTLNNWQHDGKVSLRGSKAPPMPPERAEAERKADAEADSRRRIAEGEAARKDSAIDAAVKALAAPELASLSAEFDLANPDVPRALKRGMWAVWLRERVAAGGDAGA